MVLPGIPNLGGPLNETTCKNSLSGTSCGSGKICDGNGNCTTNGGIPECDSGEVCCDNGEFALGVCEEKISSEKGCPWGTTAGADVGIRYQNQFCSGLRDICDGPLEWDVWEISDNCDPNHTCDPINFKCITFGNNGDGGGGGGCRAVISDSGDFAKMSFVLCLIFVGLYIAGKRITIRNQKRCK